MMSAPGTRRSNSSAQVNKRRSGAAAGRGARPPPETCSALGPELGFAQGVPETAGTGAALPWASPRRCVCVCSVFTREGFVTPVLRCFVRIHVVALSFLFWSHLFRCLTLPCPWSCSCPPFLSHRSIPEWFSPRPKQADPVLGGATHPARSSHRIPTRCSQPRPRRLSASASSGLCCAEVGPSVAVASPVLGRGVGWCTWRTGCRCRGTRSHFPLSAGQAGCFPGTPLLSVCPEPAPPLSRPSSSSVPVCCRVPCQYSPLAVAITSHPERRLWCTMLRG